MSYVTTVLAGSETAITNRDFVRLANRYTIADRKIALPVVNDDEEETEKKAVQLPRAARLGLLALGAYFWYFAYMHWFSDVALDAASLQFLNVLGPSIAPRAILVVSHGGGIVMSFIIAQLAHTIVKSFARGVYAGRVNKAAKAKA